MFTTLLLFTVWGFCSATKDGSGISIIGGREAIDGERLYTTGLRGSQTGMTLCGASLIAPNYLLTAAHCCEGDWFKYGVVGGHYNSGDKGGETIPLKECIRHPKYDGETGDSYDIALFELEFNATIHPIPLTTARTAKHMIDDEMMARVTGWGTMNEYGAVSPVLKEVDVQLWLPEDCEEKHGDIIDDSMICAGGVEGEDACLGDSGGPLVVDYDDEEVLIGVVSFGDGCAEADSPGVYARVDQAADFINEHCSGHRWI